MYDAYYMVDVFGSEFGGVVMMFCGSLCLRSSVRPCLAIASLYFSKWVS